jgi:hypothetical protein
MLEIYPAFGPRATRNIAENLIDQLLHAGLHISPRQITAKQSHAAINVESDAARRNDTFLDVRGRDTSNRKAVTLMYIRHGQARSNDPRQRGHILCLLERMVLLNLFHQRTSGVHSHVGPHSRGFIAGDTVAVLIDLLQYRFRHLHKPRQATHPDSWTPLADDR